MQRGEDTFQGDVGNARSKQEIQERSQTGEDDGKDGSAGLEGMRVRGRVPAYLPLASNHKVASCCFLVLPADEIAARAGGMGVKQMQGGERSRQEAR